MSLLARMIEDGVAADIIEEVAMLLAEKKVSEHAIEERRASDRERQQRRRNKPSGHVTSRDGTLQTVTPLSPSPKENISNPHPHTPGNITPVRKGRKNPQIAKPKGVSDQVWSDFTAHRNRKKAAISETALAGICREASKAGWGMEAALSEIVSRGWTGFNAEWVAGDKSKASNDPGDYLAHRLAKQAR